MRPPFYYSGRRAVDPCAPGVRRPASAQAAANVGPWGRESGSAYSFAVQSCAYACAVELAGLRARTNFFSLETSSLGARLVRQLNENTASGREGRPRHLVCFVGVLCVRACVCACVQSHPRRMERWPEVTSLLAREQLEDVRVFHRQKAPCSHYLRAQPIKCAAICNLCQWEEAPCASLQEPVPVYRTASTGMSHGNRLGGPPHVSGQWPSRLPRVHQFRTTTMPNHHNTLPLSQFQKFLALSSSKPLAPVPPTVPSSRRLLPAYGRAGGVLKAV
jgi:hypothetical protein